VPAGAPRVQSLVVARHISVRAVLNCPFIPSYPTTPSVMGQTHSMLLPAGALLVLTVYMAYTRVYLPANLPRIAPGPERAHWIFGNMRDGEPSEVLPRLAAEYGPVVSLYDIGHVRPAHIHTAALHTHLLMKSRPPLYLPLIHTRWRICCITRTFTRSRRWPGACYLKCSARACSLQRASSTACSARRSALRSAQRRFESSRVLCSTNPTRYASCGTSRIFI
jgi:hypothetical protein